MNPALKYITIIILNIYRNYLSTLKIQSCRYYPTCSHYTLQAVEKYGALRGLAKGMFRIMKCHPFSKGGYDPLS